MIIFLIVYTLVIFQSFLLQHFHIDISYKLILGTKTVTEVIFHQRFTSCAFWEESNSDELFGQRSLNELLLITKAGIPLQEGYIRISVVYTKKIVKDPLKSSKQAQHESEHRVFPRKRVLTKWLRFLNNIPWKSMACIREPVKYYLADFFR